MLRNLIRKLIHSYLIRLIGHDRLLGWVSLFHSRKLLAQNIPRFDSREELWRSSIPKFNSQKFFIELGVFEGQSLKFFSTFLTSKKTKLFGLDSFVGLPEDWDIDFKKGAFNVNGIIPVFSDSRVKLLKGWIQNTLPPLLESTSISNLIVHFDADLYSTTLFSLCSFDKLKIDYIAFFDEFTGHESRALNDYIIAYGANIEYLGLVSKGGIVLQVAVLIKPVIEYQVNE